MSELFNDAESQDFNSPSEQQNSYYFPDNGLLKEGYAPFSTRFVSAEHAFEMAIALFLKGKHKNAFSLVQKNFKYTLDNFSSDDFENWRFDIWLNLATMLGSGYYAEQPDILKALFFSILNKLPDLGIREYFKQKLYRLQGRFPNKSGRKIIFKKYGNIVSPWIFNYFHLDIRRVPFEFERFSTQLISMVDNIDLSHQKNNLSLTLKTLGDTKFDESLHEWALLTSINNVHKAWACFRFNEPEKEIEFLKESMTVLGCGCGIQPEFVVEFELIPYFDRWVQLQSKLAQGAGSFLEE